MSQQARAALNSDSRPNSLSDQRMTVSEREMLLEDRLAIVSCIANDCVVLITNGEIVPEAVWPRLRLISMCSDNGLSVWRRSTYYQRARKHIRVAISDIIDQLGRPG